MSVLPVIVRELRSQARQPLTHWLRMVGGLSVVGGIFATLWAMDLIIKGHPGRGNSFPNPVQTFGVTLFGKMNLFIFVAIWLFVPLATADAVSRERREGTLALLYLTELRSWGIVVGKAFVHLLRSVSLFLTMAPWLMLPLVFGGVGLRDLGMALMLDSASVLLALSAGLLASTIPRDWLKSAMLAELFALILLLTQLYGHGLILSGALSAGSPVATAPGTRISWNFRSSVRWELEYPGAGIIARTSRLIEYTTNGSIRKRDSGYTPFGLSGGDTDWQLIRASLTPAGHDFWFVGAAGMLVAAVLTFLAATWIAAWRVGRSWRDATPQIMVSELKRRLLLPRFGVRSLNRNLSRALTANPIGWLQYYSTSARLVKWGWCFSIIVVEIVFSANSADLYAAQAGLGLVLLLGLAFSATGSFREELETGAFELLLVTPLRERQIIAGRVRGLWRQFLPAILVYGAGSIYLATGWNGENFAQEAWLALAGTVTAFCTLPFIGLYFSVKRWNFFPAWLCACVVGLLPAALGRAFGAAEVPIILLQIGVAIAAAALLVKQLRNREFLQSRI